MFMNMPPFSPSTVNKYLTEVLESFQNSSKVSTTWVSGQLNMKLADHLSESNLAKIRTLFRDPAAAPHAYLKAAEEIVRVFAAEKAIFQV